MREIRKILFPTDFSDTARNAFRYCLALADKLGASIQILHVIYPEYEALDIPVMAARATKDKVQAARELMKQFAELGLMQVQTGYQFEEVPVVEADVEIGSPVAVIANVARRDEIDLIVMGTQGEHNTLERLFGSVTTGVLGKAECHVWVVPENARFTQIQRAAYATDLVDADPYHIWKVGKWLEAFSPILHCVHVRTGKQEGKDLNLAELKLFFKDHAPALQIHFHDISGKSVADGLEDFASTYDLDLLVMYSPQYDLLERIFHRSHTKHMALETNVPLLVIKERR